MKFYQHPEYIEALPGWQTLYDMYEGDHDTMVKPEYLWQHVLELKGDGEKLYLTRQKRTRYLNIIEMLASIWQSSAFGQEPRLSQELESLLLTDADEYNDIDGFNTPLPAFIKYQVLLSKLLYGKVIIWVDAPRNTAANLAEEQAMRIRPRMQLIWPMALKDWVFETQDPARFGRLNMARFEYEYQVPRTSLAQEPIEEIRSDVLERINGKYCVTRYMLQRERKAGEVLVVSENQEWQLIEGPIPTELTEIPLVIQDDQSWLKDAAQEALRYHNLRSTLDSVTHAQGYQKLFAFTDDKSPQAIKALGEYVVSVLGTNDKVQAIDPVPTGDLSNLCAASLESAFKIGLNQLRSLPITSKENQSAEAIDAQKTEQSDLKSCLIDEVVAVTNKALKFYAEFKNVSDIGDGISFEDEKPGVSVADLSTVYSVIRDELKGLPTLRVAALRKMAQVFDLSEDEQVDFEAELEKAPAEAPAPIANQPGQPDAIAQAMGLNPNE